MISKAQLSVLSCPRCGSPLGLENLPDSDAFIRCPSCSEEYPYTGGVLGLFYVDSTWFWPLHEILAFNEMARKALAGELEEDRVARNTQIVREVMREATEMSEEALKLLPNPRGQTLLELGSGSCTQAKELADQGYGVIAVDLNPMELLYPRPRYIEKLGDDFHASYFNQGDALPRDEVNFLRVAAEIHNLPFRDGSIESAFSRAMLHHIDPLPSAIAEVGRILQPEGIWSASGEPTSSLLEWDPMSREDWSIDYQEGVHEQSPHLPLYLKGFRMGGLRLEAFTAWHAQYRVNLGFFRRRRWRFSHLGQQLAASGPIEPTMTRALFMNTAGNFHLRKTRSAASRKTTLDCDRKRLADPIWLFDTEKYASELARVLLELIPTGALDQPARLGRLSSPEIQIKGFRLPERAEGRLLRFATRKASIYLPHPGSSRRIFFDLFRPSFQVDPISAQVRINEIECGEIACSCHGPLRVSLLLPTERLPPTGPIEVKFSSSQSWVHPDGRRLGFGMERVGYLK